MIQETRKKSGNIKVTIDDLTEGEEDQYGSFFVKKEQTYSILNLSQTKTIVVNVELLNTKELELRDD